jgi:hypothetical protein
MVLQLNKETKGGTLLEKHNVYQRANKEVKSVAHSCGIFCFVCTITILDPNYVSRLLRLL